MLWERIKFLCEKKGIKPTNLSTMLFKSSSNATVWKSGKIPNGESLIKIADYFDCSIDYLLGRTDIPEINRSANKPSLADYGEIAAHGGKMTRGTIIDEEAETTVHKNR